METSFNKSVFDLDSYDSLSNSAFIFNKLIFMVSISPPTAACAVKIKSHIQIWQLLGFWNVLCLLIWTTLLTVSLFCWYCQHIFLEAKSDFIWLWHDFWSPLYRLSAFPTGRLLGKHTHTVHVLFLHQLGACFRNPWQLLDEYTLMPGYLLYVTTNGYRYSHLGRIQVLNYT